MSNCRPIETPDASCTKLTSASDDTEHIDEELYRPQHTIMKHGPIYACSSRLLATIVGAGRSHSLVLNFTSPFFIISSIFYPDNLRFGVIFLLLDS